MGSISNVRTLLGETLVIWYRKFKPPLRGFREMVLRTASGALNIEWEVKQKPENRKDHLER